MRYEFIKVVDTQEGQVAYMIDHDRGVVVVAPVEWLGEAPVERPPVRTVRATVPTTIRRPAVVERVEEQRTDQQETTIPEGALVRPTDVRSDGLHDIGHSRPSRAASIMPAHLRGLIRKDADVEKRETIG